MASFRQWLPHPSLGTREFSGNKIWYDQEKGDVSLDPSLWSLLQELPKHVKVQAQAYVGLGTENLPATNW